MAFHRTAHTRWRVVASLAALGVALPLLPAACSSGAPGDEGAGGSLEGEAMGKVVQPLAAAQCIVIERGVLGSAFDTQIGDNEDKVSGGKLAMNVGKIGPGVRYALLDADLSPLPPVLEFVSAKLTLHVRLANHATVTAHEVLVPWSENTVTWASFFANPAPQFDPTPLDAQTTTPATTQLTFDLSGLLGELIAGYDFAAKKLPDSPGILLQQQGFYFTNFYTSEDPNPALRPQLEVCFIPDLCAGVSCPAPDQCHFEGMCDQDTGQCGVTAQAKPDGTSCDDGDAATVSDMCLAGVCAGKAAGVVGDEYALFTDGPGFVCPTGETTWTSTTPPSPTSLVDAKAACEACYGVGACHLEWADAAGRAWGPHPAGQYVCGDAYFGFDEGVTGSAGRAWYMCNSDRSYGFWGQ